jgi:hypothetical protein
MFAAIVHENGAIEKREGDNPLIVVWISIRNGTPPPVRKTRLEHTRKSPDNNDNDYVEAQPAQN